MTLEQGLSQQLCMLRRYARALLGSQAAGDEAVRRSLVALQAAAIDINALPDAKLRLFQTFSQTLATHDDSEAKPVLQGSIEIDHALADLDVVARQCFLLTSLEEFPVPQVAAILGLSEDKVMAAICQAMTQLSALPQATVMIVEDEPIIAMDLQSIVQSMGHAVGGIARTHARAVAMAKQYPPDLVLADIRLADDSSGLEAAMDILSSQNIPVIFITAYPQRLLTGQRPEPTFLIRKPFSQEQVRAAIAQALMFQPRSQRHAA